MSLNQTEINSCKLPKALIYRRVGTAHQPYVSAIQFITVLTTRGSTVVFTTILTTDSLISGLNCLITA